MEGRQVENFLPASTDRTNRYLALPSPSVAKSALSRMILEITSFIVAAAVVVAVVEVVTIVVF